MSRFEPPAFCCLALWTSPWVWHLHLSLVHSFLIADTSEVPFRLMLAKILIVSRVVSLSLLADFEVLIVLLAVLWKGSGIRGIQLPLIVSSQRKRKCNPAGKEAAMLSMSDLILLVCLRIVDRAWNPTICTKQGAHTIYHDYSTKFWNCHCIR